MTRIARHRKSLPLAVTLSFLLIAIPLNSDVSAHEGEGAIWIVSHYDPGPLAFHPIASLPQWEGARMVTVEQPNGVEARVMSINNGTYMLLLVQRDLNASIGKAGVAVRFVGDNANGSLVTWAWAGGVSLNITSSGQSIAAVSGQVLTVVFGSRTAAIGSGLGLSIGKPYDDFVQLVTWDDGSSPGSIGFQNVTAAGLELVPYMDHYPKEPLVYSAVFLAAGFGFVALEMRRYGTRSDKG